MAHFRTIRSKLSLLLILCIFCSNLFALLALSLQQQESNKLLYNSTSEALHYGAERFNTTLSSIEDLLSLLLSDSSFLNTLRQWTHTPSDWLLLFFGRSPIIVMPRPMFLLSLSFMVIASFVMHSIIPYPPHSHRKPPRPLWQLLLSIQAPPACHLTRKIQKASI